MKNGKLWLRGMLALALMGAGSLGATTLEEDFDAPPCLNQFFEFHDASIIAQIRAEPRREPHERSETAEAAETFPARTNHRGRTRRVATAVNGSSGQ